MIYFKFNFSNVQGPIVLILIEFLDFHFLDFKFQFFSLILPLNLKDLNIQLSNYFYILHHEFFNR